jgi:hypothetical protein
MAVSIIVSIRHNVVSEILREMVNKITAILNSAPEPYTMTALTCETRT